MVIASGSHLRMSWKYFGKGRNDEVLREAFSKELLTLSLEEHKELNNLKNRCLAQETNDAGIPVLLAVAGFYRGDDDECDPRYEENWKKEKSDEDKAKQSRNGEIDRVGNLKVQYLFSGCVNDRAIGSFDQPDYEGGKDMSQRPTEDDAGES